MGEGGGRVGVEGLWGGWCFCLFDNFEMVYFFFLLVRTRVELVFVWIWSFFGLGKWWRRRVGFRRYSYRGRSLVRCICYLIFVDWSGFVKEKIDIVKIMINIVWIIFYMINMLFFFVRVYCSENIVKFGYIEFFYYDLLLYNFLLIYNVLEI